MTVRHQIALVALAIVGMAGVAFAQTDTPTETPTETPTSVPTDTPTETPTATPTDTITQTPTLTPTSTPTVTVTNTPVNTVTPTLANPVPEGSTDFAAFKYGSMRVPTPVCPTPASENIVIPGLKMGDSIVVYPPIAYRGGISWRILTNNILQLNMACTTAGGQDWDYVWFNRTQNKCQGGYNCRPAPTVTPTP